MLKKVFAVMLAVVLMMALSVTAFAADSPVAAEKHKVVMVHGDQAPKRVVVSNTGDNANRVELVADTALGTFEGWSFYLKDGSAATENVHYEFVSGNASEASAAVVLVKTDLIIVANYAGKTANIQAAIPLFNDDQSPETGDVATLSLAVVMIVALGGIAVARKRLAA